MPKQVDENTMNVIDNLIGLQECLEAGEDWCSVAIIAGAIELLQSRRVVTRERINSIAMTLLNGAGLSYSADPFHRVIELLTEHYEVELGIEVKNG